MKERVLSIFNFESSESVDKNVEQGIERRNITICHSIKIIAGLFLTTVLLVRTIYFLDPGKALYKTEPFYTRASEYDVLFMGNSHMAMAIAPMELWQDYGVRSYNLANLNQPIIASYWQLKDALEYAHPKVVVIDVYGIEDNIKCGNTHWYQHWGHNLLDNMNNQELKEEAIKDLFSPEDWNEFYFPFSAYHNRWKNIDITFWDRRRFNAEKGGEMDAAVTMGTAGTQSVERPEIVEPDDYDKSIVGNRIGAQYLEKMIELCQEKEIEVLLTAIPFSANDSRQRIINTAYEVAEYYKIPFLNMFYTDILLNWDTDFMDWGHLNSSGMRKVTDAMGKYLTEHYSNLISENVEKCDQIQMAWDSDYEAYLSYKLDWLRAQEELKSYLMLLCDDDYQIVMDIRDYSCFLDKDIDPYFRNLGMGKYLDSVESMENEFGNTGCNEGTNELLIAIEFCSKKPCAGEMSETEISEFIGNSDEKSIYVLDDEQGAGMLGIYVFRADSKEILDMRWF